MGSMASQITSLAIVYSTVYSGADERKHQSSTSLAFVQMASNAEDHSIWWRHHEQINLGSGITLKWKRFVAFFYRERFPDLFIIIEIKNFHGISVIL